ncbi:MAG: hypothetical protein JXA49_03520 [Actinobacteria bacterium]|nr:hypothetical protein [Actinomycetota bacterium]
MNRFVRAYMIGVLGLLPLAVYSIIPRKPDPAASMHPCDFPLGEDAMKPRRFRSPGHIFHHSKELLDLGYYIFNVYTLRGLPARFRESIMMRTAMVNSCLG